MIQIQRLAKLHGIALTRKCALLLEGIERELFEAGIGLKNIDQATIANLAIYVQKMAEFLGRSPETSAETKAAALSFLEMTDKKETSGTGGFQSGCASLQPDGASLQPGGTEFLRAINDFRHILMKVSGQAPADWDLHDYLSPAHTNLPGSSSVSGTSVGAIPERNFLPGLRVYLEDIRSPFNVGTILRTAEALGFEEVLLSPNCADPRHPRAARSSMGAVDMIPWRRCALEALPTQDSIFALELGGSPLNLFAFPRQGILILGSEELGVSSPALSLSGDRRVTIPMRGIKASINVAVAFGIAAQAWISSI